MSLCVFKPRVPSFCNSFQVPRYCWSTWKEFTWPTVLIKSLSSSFNNAKNAFFFQVTSRLILSSRWYYTCWYMTNIFRANSHTWRQRDVVHYIKKQFTVHVLVGLSVPPCQHDGSLLHTERLRWLEVGAAMRNDASHALYSRAAPMEEVDVPAMRWWHSVRCDIWYVYKQ